MNTDLGYKRIPIHRIPSSPVGCDKKCVYNNAGECADPRTYKGNSDAQCYKESNRSLLQRLTELPKF